jgi:hypothetical protein
VKIFVSSTIKEDLGDLRDEFYRRLKDLGHIPWFSEQPDFPTDRHTDSMTNSIMLAEECDLFVVLLDRRAGMLYNKRKGSPYPELFGLTNSEAEYRNARKNHKPVRIFIRNRTECESAIYRKLLKEKIVKKEDLEKVELWYAEPAVYEFYNRLMHEKPNIPWRHTFDSIGEIMEVLKPVIEEDEYPKAHYKRYKGIADLLNIPVRDFLGKLKGTQSKISTKDTRNMQKAMAGGLLKEAVALYYPASVLEAEGLKHYSFSVDNASVITAVATKPEWTGLEIPLGGKCEKVRLISVDNLVMDLPEEKVLQQISSIEQMNCQMWDQTIYRLLDVDFRQGMLKASFAKDKYLRSMFSAGVVSNELAEALSKKSYSAEQVIADADRLLPIRKSILPDGASLINFRKRICAGGIAMMFAIPRPDPDYDFAFIVQQRSDTVADTQNMLTIIPRAIHQPMLDEAEEVNPSFSAFREIFEELYSGEKVKKDVQKLRHDWFFSEENMKWFRDNPKCFDLMCTCFGIDMLSGNYVFGMLLVIREESYWDKYAKNIEANWEGRGLKPVYSKDPDSLAQLIKRKQWTGDGLFPLIEGLKWLADKYPERVKMPPLHFYY